MRGWLLTVAIMLVSLVRGQFPAVSSPTQPTGQPNARAAVFAFLSAMKAGDLDAARQVLDLSDLNFAIRDTEGSRRAQMLNSVLNRIDHFRPETISDKSDLRKVVIPLKTSEGNSDIGRLELAPMGASDWRFTAETVGALPSLWVEVRDQVPLNDLPTEYEGTLDSAQELRSRINRQLWREFLGVETWQWLAFAVLIAAGWLFGRFLRLVVISPLRKKLGEEGMRDWRHLKRGISWWVSASLWFYALPYLDLPGWLGAPLTILVKTALTVAGILIGVILVDIVVHMASRRTKSLVRRADSLYFPILRNFARFIVIGVAVLAYMASLDVNVTGFVAGLGIGGLVLALAAKDSVENIFGSLTILFDMPFGLGDWVKIGADVNGVVEEINLRSTRIRTFADSVVTVPNSNLTKAAVENFGARRQRRIDLNVGISHRNELDDVIRFADKLRDWMRSDPHIRPDNAYAYVSSLSDAGVTVLVQGYILTSDYEEELRVRQTLVESMAKLAAEEGVELGPINWPTLHPPAAAKPVAEKS